MKKTFLAAMFSGIITTAAITTAVFASETIEILSETPVKLEDLPEAVKKTLVEKYEGWTATAAFLVTGETDYYKVEIAKGEEKQVTKIAKDGSLVTEKSGFYDLQSETPIKVEELPDPVKKAIVEKFEGWTATKASYVAPTDSEKEYYKVGLEKENEKKLVKFDKDGAVIE